MQDRTSLYLASWTLYNVTAVKNKIEEMDETFDLVLMAERFDESMILLKDQLCWDYQDVVNFKLNARKESKKTTLSQDARAALKEYLASDYLLYDYFKAKFEARVDQFGLPRLSEELSVLRQANEKMKSKCALKTVDNDKIVGANKLHGQGMVAYTADEAADPECGLYSLSEMNFIDKLREIQTERASRIGQNLNIDVESLDELMVRQSMSRLPFNSDGLPDVEKMKSLYIHT